MILSDRLSVELANLISLDGLTAPRVMVYKSYITIYHKAGRSVKRIIISLPEDFLEEIDDIATQEHRSRSELIREATRRYLAEVRKERPIDNPKIRKAFKSLDELKHRWTGKWQAEEIIRKMRSER